MDISVVTSILPKLFISDASAAIQLDVLRAYNITHIVNVTTEVDCLFAESIQYCHLPISALEAEDPEGLFLDMALSFIESAISTGGDNTNVLVHCVNGVSRSVAVAIYYLMTVRNMHFHEAYHFVRSKHSIAFPSQALITILVNKVYTARPLPEGPAVEVLHFIMSLQGPEVPIEHIAQILRNHHGQVPSALTELHQTALVGKVNEWMRDRMGCARRESLVPIPDESYASDDQVGLSPRRSPTPPFH